MTTVTIETNWYFMVLAVVPGWIVVGNSLVMWVVLRCKSLQTLLNVVIASLAFTDFLLAVIVVPCGILQLICGRWILGFYACLAWTGCDVMLSTSSILHLCAIAIHRFRGIAYPLHTRSATGRDVVLLLVPAWAVSVAICIPFIVQATRQHRSVFQAVNPDDSIAQLLTSRNDSKPNEETKKIPNHNNRLPIADDVIDDVIVHCGIFDHMYVIYSSLVSFFIPLAVMIFADIGSIRTLRKNASSKFKRPTKFHDDKNETSSRISSKEKLFSDRCHFSADQISNENLSISTLASPLTPTFQGQIQGSSKQMLFYTPSSNLSPNIDNTGLPSINNKYLTGHPHKQNLKWCKNRTKCFGESKKKKINGNSDLKASTFSRLSETDIHHHHHYHYHHRSSSAHQTETSHPKILRMFELVRLSKKSEKDQAISNDEMKRKYFPENQKLVNNTNSDDNNSARKNVRPRTRSLMKMEKLSSRGRERRAEKTLVCVFLMFVVLWLPFFCTNLTYGVCGVVSLAGVFVKGNNRSSDYINIPSSSSSSITLIFPSPFSPPFLSSPQPSSSSSPSHDSDSTTASSCYISSQLMTAFTWLGYLSSGVNPCIYTLLNKDFRRAFINTLTCRGAKRLRARTTIIHRGTKESDVIDG